jgi:hypothetical protein
MSLNENSKDQNINILEPDVHPVIDASMLELNPYQISWESFIFLSHGGDKLGEFILPDNIELVTFNRPGLLFYSAAVKEIMKTLHIIPPSMRILSRPLTLIYPDGLEQIAQSIRITYYEPKSVVPNLELSLSEGPNDINQYLSGLFTTKNADIDYTVPKKLSGAVPEFDSSFIMNALHGDNTKRFTTQDVVTYLSQVLNLYERFKGKRVRLYMISCRSLDTIEENTNMDINIFSVLSLTGGEFIYPINDIGFTGLTTYIPPIKRKRENTNTIRKQNKNNQLNFLPKRPKTRRRKTRHAPQK